MRSTSLLLGLVAILFVSVAQADIYLHVPRGMNDRCDEKSNDRNNDQRVYNSQNNAAGGYSWCDQELFFYEGTTLSIQWYSQHACGNDDTVKTDPKNPENVICQLVLQLGCEPDFANPMYAGNESSTYAMTDGISLGRPGADIPSELTADPEAVFNTFGNTCTQTKPTSETCAAQPTNDATCSTLNLATDSGTFNSATCQCSARKMLTYAYYEPEFYWYKCRARQRNMGLFTADQNPNNIGGATRTRQQPNSARYGFECPEERDYWPYWHPTPFRDLAVLTSDTSLCKYYQSQSQNTNNKCECIPSEANPSWDTIMQAAYYNQQVTCEANQFTWSCNGNFNWQKPDCILAPEGTDNTLGRPTVRGKNNEHNDGSKMARYDWVIPNTLILNGQDEIRCQIRIRYNISTNDIGFNWDFTNNDQLTEDPVWTVGPGNSSLPSNVAIPLRMAIDTAQYGRTFEDRTWIFSIRKRPSNLKNAYIHNLTVRGKRGNIAQVRNCVEYDFIPILLTVNKHDYIHFQWCGSDYNNNGNAGEGLDGTDRSNFIAIQSFSTNHVVPFNQTSKPLLDSADLQYLAWLGQQPQYCYTTEEMLTTQANSGNDPMSCHFLNGVRDANGFPTAYVSYIAQVQNTGVFKYISSRNNNFTNRSQKGQITVLPSRAAIIAGAVIGSLAGVALIGGAIFFAYKKGKLTFLSNMFTPKRV